MPISLKHNTPSGDHLEAVFLPEKGMNMISFKKNEQEVIDQSTFALFEERFAGLGSLIGPHFHRRNPQILPKIPDENLFPHIARVKAKGIQDPFSHGIARYAPWEAQINGNRIQARLSGKHLWNGIPLAVLEGQQFSMNFEAELSSNGLHINLSIASEIDSLVGLHYYYALPQEKGTITSDVQSFYLTHNEKLPIPSEWNFSSQNKLIFDLTQEADFTFYPFPNPLKASILLDAIDYKLLVSYSCQSQENCWQLYRPLGTSFVCLEPISAQDPRHPNLTASAINVNLEIL